MKKTTIIFAIMALLGLGACGNVPRPFSEGPKVTTDNPLLDVPTAVGIAVLPVRGAPEPLNTQISGAVAQRLQTFDIPAEPLPVNRGLGFTLEGEARPVSGGVIAPTAAEVPLIITWTLRSRRGAAVRSYRQVVSVPGSTWTQGNMETATKLGNDAALAMGDLINGIAIPAQGPAVIPKEEAKPAAPMPKFPTVSVKPVEGAPGDGREALRLAVLQSLNDNGVRRDDVKPQVVLNCRMTSSPYDSSSQKVEIVWTALDAAGTELGTVKLDNTIPNGALDGPWGPTAYAVAGAALNDLLVLLASHVPNEAPPTGKTDTGKTDTGKTESKPDSAKTPDSKAPSETQAKPLAKPSAKPASKPAAKPPGKVKKS